MDHDSWRLREALEKLRGWGMPSVFICLNSEFGYTDNTLSRPLEDTGAANRDELRAMVGLVENGLERAAQEVLELTGKNLGDYENPCFELTANLTSSVFEYRGYEESCDVAMLQRNQRNWPIDDGAFFEEVGFSSGACAGSQPDVLEAWRPHPAKSLEFSWNSTTHSVSIRGNKGSIYYDAIWPECVPSEIKALRKAFRKSLPTPENMHLRGWWSHDLVIDFETSRIQFMQSELLDVQNEFCSGIMPLSELVWLAVSFKDRVSLSEVDRAAWIATGIARREVTTEEVIAKVGIGEIESELESAQVMESDENFDPDEPGEFEEDPGYRDEISLLGEELSESEEGYARSEEEGWYYADD